MESKRKEIYLQIDTALCSGCQACEVSCSFHLKRTCDPTISKIKVTRYNETGEVFCDLPLSCPECSFEAEAPCVASCTIRALTIKDGMASDDTDLL